MTGKRIRPFILAGGSGTRLWPLSRKARPKQFLKLTDNDEEHSLFQQTVLRVGGDGFASPAVLGNAEHRFLIAEQLRETGVENAQIILEPVARNTAPAALTAALLGDPDDLILLMPSDHYIPETERFVETVMRAREAAERGAIVTFGVVPSGPETGYGYIETAEGGAGGLLKVLRFVEKPEREVAEKFVASGNFYWNAGIFLFSAATMREAFERHAPDLLPPCSEALEKARRDFDFLRLDEKAYGRNRSVSVDYAVMEHADNIVCQPLDVTWSDLGSWDAVWNNRRHDGQGNAVAGDAILHDTRNSLVMQSDGPCLSVVGLENVIAVATKDAVLVASRDRCQEVRQIVTRLSSERRDEAVQHLRVYRPWGWFEQLAIGERYQVKSLMVKPGAQLSLQSHYHRAEHWIVVCGTVRVTNGDTEFLLTENESTYIPIGNRHRLENPGKVPALLIEVQSGSYLGEDDIVRYEDRYGRHSEDA